MESRRRLVVIGRKAVRVTSNEGQTGRCGGDVRLAGAS